MTVFKISFISSFEIISTVTLDPKIFFWIVASVADVTAVNPNVIRTLLANDLSTVLIKGKPHFNNEPKILPKNYPYCPILCNCIFDNFILTDALFAKALRSLKTCVLVNNNFCGKWVSSLKLPITFDERLKVTSVPFFVLDFN